MDPSDFELENFLAQSGLPRRLMYPFGGDPRATNRVSKPKRGFNKDGTRRKKPGPKKTAGRKRAAAARTSCGCLELADNWRNAAPRPGGQETKCPLPSCIPCHLRLPGSSRARKCPDGSVLDCIKADAEWLARQGDAYGPPEPKEKPVNYSSLLAKTEHDLDWYGKYDALSDARQRTLGGDIAIRITNTLKKLYEYLQKPKGCQSFANKIHVVTVMREIISAVVNTNGRIGSECRKYGFEYDDHFLWAVQTLSAGQLARLRELDGGAWVTETLRLVKDAKDYCVFEKVGVALRIVDPEAEAEAMSSIPELGKESVEVEQAAAVPRM